MRFADLKPEGWRVYRDRDKTADNGGFPTDDHELTFICPTCGPPYSIIIKVGPGAPDIGQHRWHANPQPFSAPDWADHITIQPSIDNTKAGHGRKHPNCGAHFSITNGEVIKS